jgi:hypothetical protein
MGDPQIIHSNGFFIINCPFWGTLFKIHGKPLTNAYQSSESLGCSETKRGGWASLRRPEETCHPACGATAKSRPIEERNFNAKKLTYGHISICMRNTFAMNGYVMRIVDVHRTWNLPHLRKYIYIIASTAFFAQDPHRPGMAGLKRLALMNQKSSSMSLST